MNQKKEGSNYWKGRWERKETGWHQAEPEPHMISFFKDLGPQRVFVPLCGKSNDLMWLLSRGHEVIGVELSERACESFFADNNIEFKKAVQKDSIIYQAPHITILNQDFFSVTPDQLGRIGAVYDRAALIALPEEIRLEYSGHMIELVRKCSDQSLIYCQIVLERTPHDQLGPPFSVSEQEVIDLFGAAFKIVPVSRELESQDALTRSDECVFSFVWK